VTCFATELGRPAVSTGAHRSRFQVVKIQEEFNALIQEYDNRDVVVRAVTGILATTADAASISPGEARELVSAIAAEAREAID
jgi:hypothetical protein